jgi:hypothetical protein
MCQARRPFRTLRSMSNESAVEETEQHRVLGAGPAGPAPAAGLATWSTAVPQGSPRPAPVVDAARTMVHHHVPRRRAVTRDNPIRAVDDRCFDDVDDRILLRIPN